MASVTHTPRPLEEDKSKDSMEQVKDSGMHAVDKAKEAASSVGDIASKAVATVGKKAEDFTATAGCEIKHWGDALSEKTSHEGLIGHASQAVADTLKGSGRYLEQTKFSGMADDVTEVIKRNPVPAVLVGFSLGFILGRALRS